MTPPDAPKNLNTARLENKTINLYFSAPISSRDVSPSYFEIKSQNKNLAVDSVNLNDSRNAARIILKKEPEVGSTVNIIYKSSSKSILQSFEKTFQVSDVVTPVPIKGIAYADRLS